MDHDFTPRRRALDRSAVEAFFDQYQGIPENKVCFECGAKDPSWADTSHGTMVCINCVQRSYMPRHRTMDTWSREKLTIMALGGNDNLRAWLKQHPDTKNYPSIEAKYNYSQTFKAYRALLAEKVKAALSDHL